jgi:hypothetical protein
MIKHLGGFTGWYLSTTEADSFAVWLTLGNTVHGEPKNINFIFSWPPDGLCLVYQAVGTSWGPRRAEERHFNPAYT